MRATDLNRLKVAIVHDFAWYMRGGEKCLDAFCSLYPQADVYMLCGNTAALTENIKKHKITYSFVQKIPFISKIYRYTYFLWPVSIESFNFNNYDLVLSSSAVAAKGVITPIDTLHVCYMHSPMRYAWDKTWDYFNPTNFSWWKRLIIPFLLVYLRMWDIASNQRIDRLIVNSNFVAKRVKKYYKRDVDAVIYPPVDIDKCKEDLPREDYYVAFAPFEPNKGGSVLIDWAKKSGKKLVLIGDGSMRKQLQKESKNFNNIVFTGRISEDEKFNYLGKAKGFIICGVEEFGITVVEALGSGTPVIAYKAGGSLELVQDDINGLFFNEQSVEALEGAVAKFEKCKFDSKVISEGAKKFSRERYVEEVKKFINEQLVDERLEIRN